MGVNILISFLKAGLQSVTVSPVGSEWIQNFSLKGITSFIFQVVILKLLLFFCINDQLESEMSQL